jgi:hypothetical protein
MPSRRAVAFASLIVLALSSGLTGGAAAQARVFSSTVAGVIEDSTGSPIIGAEILLPGSDSKTRTGPGGTYRLGGLPPGPVLLTVRRLGYLSQTQTVMLREGETSYLDVTLPEVVAPAVTMPTAVIVAQLRPIRSVFQQWFLLRKLNHPGGVFFDRQDIEMMNPRYTSDVFRMSTGLNSVRDRRGQTQWFMRGATTTTNCPARFFIDGNSVPLMGMSIDELVNPSDVEGIEIYKGMSSVPAEFSGRSLNDDSRCGVVAIWTKTGHY